MLSSCGNNATTTEVSMAQGDSSAGLNAAARGLVKGAAFKLIATHKEHTIAHDLYRFRCHDGREFTEFVQAEYNAPNPIIFCALRDSAGKDVPETLWTAKEMSDICGVRYAS